MTVYIGGEDFVTKEIAKRLIKFCMADTEIEFEDLTFRAHGTRALETLNVMLNFASDKLVNSVAKLQKNLFYTYLHLKNM